MKSVTLSSSKVEYIILSEATKQEVKLIVHVIESRGIEVKKTVVI